MDKNRLFIYLNPCIMFSMATDLPEENRMKALTLLDDVSQFHWSMLKSVLLILSMLPVAQGVFSVWVCLFFLVNILFFNKKINFKIYK